jgi:hypothetical protein
MPHINAFSPAAAWNIPFYLFVVFALAERKNDKQKEEKVPLRMITSGPPHTSCHRMTHIVAQRSVVIERRGVPSPEGGCRIARLVVYCVYDQPTDR